jgi:hypothetical protein
MSHQNGASPVSAPADGEAREIAGAGELNAQISSHSSLQSQAPIRAVLAGNDKCTAEGITVRAAAPALAICRRLIAAGFDSSRSLHAYRGDTLCLVVRSIGKGAELVIDERRMAPARWKPIRRAEVTPSISRRRRAATPGTP